MLGKQAFWVGLTVFCGGLSAMGATALQAAPTADEAALIAFLDKEYRASFFQIGSLGRRADGNYTWSATFHRELRKPADKLRIFCQNGGGEWRLLVTAGNVRIHPGQTELVLGGSTFRIENRDLWEWIGQSGGGPERAIFGGFEGVFDSRLIVGRARTVAEADADPPLGLFGCVDVQGTTKWAVSIMPGAYGGNSWLYLHILPVTYDFLESKRRAAAEQEAQRIASEVDSRRRSDAEARAAAAENARLSPWRNQLKIGDRTNCGLVIDVRGPLVEIQLPSNMSGPNGVQRYWMRRDQLSDSPAPDGCTLPR